MPGDRPNVLVAWHLVDAVADDFATRFNVRDITEMSDPRAWLAANGSTIRGFAHSYLGKVDAAFLEMLPALEIISHFGVGYDDVDVAAAARRNIVVTNTPDVLTDEVADLTVGLLIATVRRIPQAERHLREGLWASSGRFPLSATLRGKRVGILGLGRIGQAVATRLEAFGLTIAYNGRHRQPGVPYAYYPTAVALASAVDILVVATPGGEGTRRLIDAGLLKALGPNGVLINVARGSVVDEAALVQALNDGTIAAAGLDVFEDEPCAPAALIACDNAVLLPHIAAASFATRDAMARLVLDNLASWFDGKGPLTPVAETPWPQR